jgi:hypothetical protein
MQGDAAFCDRAFLGTMWQHLQKTEHGLLREEKAVEYPRSADDLLRTFDALFTTTVMPRGHDQCRPTKKYEAFRRELDEYCERNQVEL